MRVGALRAVPVHIRQLTASVCFDTAARSAAAEAELLYEIGPHSGHPLFDLRQEVQRVWLDGLELEVASIAARAVGEDGYSTVRLIDRFQQRGSVHRLRVRYALGQPSSQPGGAYPPVLRWLADGTVRWSLGMADLLAGRHLEAWFPSNLPFDRFPFALALRITGTAAAHSLITNGRVRTSEANWWAIGFPEWFTCMSALVELRARTALESAHRSVVLPASGRSVDIDLWKPAGAPEDLLGGGRRIAELLGVLDRRFGDFDGDRYTCFFHGAEGGMEYAHATTTSEGALEHEVLHSWFARGVTPASDADGWWDEAFTTYRSTSPLRAEPFDFTEPPLQLCSRRPMDRRTPPAAYPGGSRFFRGVADATGVGRLDGLMRALYLTRNRTAVSTPELEEFLVARSGCVELVDAFHRFVYGFEDPGRPLELRFGRPPLAEGADTPGAAGMLNPAGALLTAPWVRRRPDGGWAHQEVPSHSAAWVHACITNAGSVPCPHFVVVVAIRSAGPTPSGPGPVASRVAAVAGFDLRPGESRIVAARVAAGQWPSVGTEGHRGVRVAVSLHARNLHPPAGDSGPLAAHRIVAGARPRDAVGIGPGEWSRADLPA
jgi:hypothetical protein